MGGVCTQSELRKNERKKVHNILLTIYGCGFPAGNITMLKIGIPSILR